MLETSLGELEGSAVDAHLMCRAQHLPLNVLPVGFGAYVWSSPDHELEEGRLEALMLLERSAELLGAR